jgi:hypothetical protein
MLKFVSKFAMDILPSVVATILGAYIVNHYIVAKPGANAPVAAAASADSKSDVKSDTKADVKKDAKPAQPSELANIPEAGVKAKGISEKAILEKTAAEKPTTAEKPAEKSVDKAEKSADRPTETASIPPVEARRRQALPREKTTGKTVPAPVQPVITPLAAPSAAPSIEATIAPEEHRDANDLARAAIERLRGASEGLPRAQEATRVPDAARIPDTPRVVSAPPMVAPVMSAPQVRPLPPPVVVSTPAAETFGSATGSSQVTPPYAAARIDDPSRPTPPADIPSPSSSRPLDLQAEATTQPSMREHTTVAEDVLSAAKSVFGAVLPK